eukprot:198185-Karenia_brevis.AAC.1
MKASCSTGLIVKLAGVLEKCSQDVINIEESICLVIQSSGMETFAMSISLAGSLVSSDDGAVVHFVQGHNV